jgi:hypothetical protein
MLNWLASLVNVVSGANRQLWNNMVAVIQAVVTYFASWITQVETYAGDISSFASALYQALFRFVLSEYTPFKSWVQQQFFTITVREDQDYRTIGGDIAALQARTDKQITIVQQTVSDGLSGLLQWIIQHIFNPLFGDVTRALDWIANEGAFLFDLLTHADKLILYLLKFLGGEWRVLAEQYGKIVLRWFMASIRMLAPEFITMLEDIISSVL